MPENITSAKEPTREEELLAYFRHSRRWVRALARVQNRWEQQAAKAYWRAHQKPQGWAKIKELMLAREPTEKQGWAKIKESVRLQWLVGHSSAPWENTLITWLSYFLCKRARIEWLGDLYEMRGKWQEQGFSRWSIYVQTFGVAIWLLWAQLHCGLYDRVFAKYSIQEKDI